MLFRSCLTRPEIFKTQLRALYRAAVYGNISIMFPMIISVKEVLRIKEIIAEIKEELKNEAEHMEYRSKIEIEGQIRIVTVPGYDVCACCAPHVKRTGEIGLIKLTGMQRYKGGVRVTMLCGVRALSDYAVKQEQAADISALLCAKQNEIAEAVHHLRDECAGLKSQIVGKDRKLVMYQAEMVPDEEETVCIFSDDIEGENMRLLMNKVLERERKLCAVFHGDGSGGYRYVIGSRSADMRPFVKEFNAAFDGRGGGRPEMVQGTASGNEEDIKAWILEKAGSMQ